MAHRTKDKGDLGIGATIADLIKHGIKVCMPLSDHLPFDIIAVSPNGEKLIRLQVKYREAKNGKIYTVVQKTTGKKWEAIPTTEIDAIALYCPDTDKVYYIPRNKLAGKGTSLCIRIAPAKNNQALKTRNGDNLTNPLQLFETPA